LVAVAERGPWVTADTKNVVSSTMQNVVSRITTDTAAGANR